jgi:hypothetical protein
MEDRIQGGLKEGAGLEESRLNKDFIDFLQKWSTPVLLVIAAIAGSYFLYGKYQQSRDAALARAFAQLDAAMISRNPASLIQVADEQSGRAAVPLLAHLAAGDLYLDSSRTGIPAGIQVDVAGALPEGVSFLTEDEIKAQLAKAETEYNAVFSAANRDKGLAIHTIGALFGLASVAESRGEFDKATQHYNKLIEVATSVGFTREADAAKKRIDSLPSLQQMPPIYKQADLFVIKSAVNPTQVKMPDGSVVTIDAGSATDNSAGPESTAKPAQVEPAPAPAPEPEPADPGR